MSDIERRPAPQAAPGLIERMGIEVIRVDANECVARMPVAGNTQPFGLLHGGASAVLAETVGSLAAWTHAREVYPQGEPAAVGIELSISHHRSARTGTVTGRARGVHLGRRTASYLVEVTDEAERLISSARLTCLLLPESTTNAESAATASGA